MTGVDNAFLVSFKSFLGLSARHSFVPHSLLPDHGANLRFATISPMYMKISLFDYLCIFIYSIIRNSNTTPTAPRNSAITYAKIYIDTSDFITLQQRHHPFQTMLLLLHLDTSLTSLSFCLKGYTIQLFLHVLLCFGTTIELILTMPKNPHQH